jgi:hypothetical protein
MSNKSDSFELDFNEPMVAQQVVQQQQEPKDIEPLGLNMAIPLGNGKWKLADLAHFTDEEMVTLLRFTCPYFKDKDLDGVTLDRTYRRRCIEDITAFYTPASENKGFFIRKTK